MKVVELRRDAPENIVESLRKLLAKAEKGDLVGFVACYEYINHTYSYEGAFTKDCNVYGIVGQLDIAKHQLISSLIPPASLIPSPPEKPRE